MRPLTHWTLLAAVCVGALGLAGCEQDRDLKLTPMTAPPAAPPDEHAAGVPATPPMATSEPNAMGGGPAMGATSGTVAKEHACVLDDAAKTEEVLGFLHATNRAETTLAKLAVDRAKSEAVKAHARALMRDHAALDEKLVALAKTEGLDLERTMTDPIAMGLTTARDAHAASLALKTGQSFDAAYVGPESSDHWMALKVVEQGQKSAKSPAVIALLGDAHKLLQQHEEQSMKLQDDLMLTGGAKAAPKAMGGGPMLPKEERPDTSGY